MADSNVGVTGVDILIPESQIGKVAIEESVNKQGIEKASTEITAAVKELEVEVDTNKIKTFLGERLSDNELGKDNS